MKLLQYYNLIVVQIIYKTIYFFSRCPNYGALPAGCYLKQSTSDPICCKEPECTFKNTKNQTSGYLTPPTPPPGVIIGGVATPTPIPSLAPSPGSITPSVGPTPKPAREYCCLHCCFAYIMTMVYFILMSFNFFGHFRFYLILYIFVSYSDYIICHYY